MLVGDYCPRALDPIHEMLEAQKDLETAAQALDVITESAIESPSSAEEATELPCNVFGTVDRCDGMACEHDGNCFSGCCSLFVSGDQKRCMPLVGGDLCPIAIDVVEKFKIVADEEVRSLAGHEIDLEQEIDFEDFDQEHEHESEEEDVHPIIEKGEHHDLEEEVEVDEE